MLPIPCLLKYRLNIYSVDCHNSKKKLICLNISITNIWTFIEIITWRQRTNLLFIPGAYLRGCYTLKNNSKLKTWKQTNKTPQIQQNKQTNPSQPTPPPKPEKKDSNQQTNKKKPTPPQPQETTPTKTNKNPWHTPKPVKDYYKNRPYFFANQETECIRALLNLESSSFATMNSHSPFELHGGSLFLLRKKCFVTFKLSVTFTALPLELGTGQKLLLVCSGF